MSTQANQLRLSDFIREIPDFPKPGILFRDITPLLACPAAFRQAIKELASFFRGKQIEVVAAVEARGFLFAAPLALEFNAALVPIRKPGKLPYLRRSLTYQLEYGSDTLEIHADAFPQGARVLLVDDLLATGGTAEACCRLIEEAGGQVLGCAFLVELTALHGAERLAKYKPFSLIKCD